MARFSQQEKADLLHVCAGGDVDEIILLLWTKRIITGKVVERTIHLLEIPGIYQLLHGQLSISTGGNAFDVGSHASRNVLVRFQVNQLVASDRKVGMFAKGNGRPPPFPAFFMKT